MFQENFRRGPFLRRRGHSRLARLCDRGVCLDLAETLLPVPHLGPAQLADLCDRKDPRCGSGSDSLLALLFAGWIAVMAWVMAEAMAIADKNAQFI